jgi:hypothetical protein
MGHGSNKKREKKEGVQKGYLITDRSTRARTRKDSSRRPPPLCLVGEMSGWRRHGDGVEPWSTGDRKILRYMLWTIGGP